MTGFRKASVRVKIQFDITGRANPMVDEFGSWFRPDTAEATISSRKLVEVMFTGSRCTKAGLPIVVTPEQKEDPRFSTYTSVYFDYEYLSGDRAVWPTVLRDLFNHVQTLEV